MLQAEMDREMVRRRAGMLAEEHAVMQNVPGWRVGESVYKTGRYAPQFTRPAFDK